MKCIVYLCGAYDSFYDGFSNTDSTALSVGVADPSGRSVEGVGLRPPACWDHGFESHRGYGCLSLVSVVCCQVEVSASS
jgi:hypothetical protein